MIAAVNFGLFQKGYSNSLNSLSFKGGSFTSSVERHNASLKLLNRDVFEKSASKNSGCKENDELSNVSTRGEIRDEAGRAFNRHATSMFRYDINWAGLGGYLSDRFDDEEKVNTHIYACSNGSEAYSTSILLQYVFGKDAYKFFPIEAKDINAERIKEAKSEQATERTRVYRAYLPAKYSLNAEEDEERIHPFIERKLNLKTGEETEWISAKTKSPIEFTRANILDDIENIDTEHPSIIMCRNMWPYVDPSEYDDFAKRLYERLAKGSVVILGEYDCMGEEGMKNSDKLPGALLRAGFTPSVHSKEINPCCTLLYEKN